MSIVITAHARRWAVKLLVRRTARHYCIGYADMEAAADRAEKRYVSGECSSGASIFRAERELRALSGQQQVRA